MKYPVVAYGDPVLRKKAEVITSDEGLEQLIEDMFSTMYEASGVGLAAPQIGKSIRLFVVDGEPMDGTLKGFKKVFINPELLEASGDDMVFEEGCLSIPGIRADVIRPEKVRLRYTDEGGTVREEEFDGIAARIIQHEYDHLEGVLFIDKISPFKKRLIQSKLNDISRGKTDADYRMRFYKKK